MESFWLNFFYFKLFIKISMIKSFNCITMDILGFLLMALLDCLNNCYETGVEMEITLNFTVLIHWGVSSVGKDRYLFFPLG